MLEWIERLKRRNIPVDADLVKTLYHSLHPLIRFKAKVVLLPVATDTGVVYAINNKQGIIERFNFSRASQATYFNSNKDIQLVGNNIPRIDYKNYSDELKLLIEKEKTNYLAKSDFRLDTSDRESWVYPPYVNNIFDTDHAVYTIINATIASRIQRIITLNGGTHNISIYGDNHNHTITFRNFVNANVTSSNGFGYNGYKIHNCNFTVITGGGSVTIRPYMPIEQGWSNEQLFVKYIQIENGIDQTSYIPTTNTSATRSADLLSYTLKKPCSVYLKTTKQNVVLDKPAGLWNVHNDLNNEGINLLVVFDRVLTSAEKTDLLS